MSSQLTEPASSKSDEAPLESEIAPERLLELLSEKYGGMGLAHEFNEERDLYSALIPQLVEKLRPFRLDKPVGIGSTATVWVLFDPNLKVKRALKLTRPRLSKLSNIVRVLRAERERLAALNHQNIIRIYSADEVAFSVGNEEYAFPYFVMEFLEGVQDLGEYIDSHHKTMHGSELILWFRDVFTGLEYLHSQGVIHCDLKPANILIAPNRPALIADLGYAKHLPRSFGQDSLGLTEVVFTPEFSHPKLRKRVKESSDPNANRADISHDELSSSYDLFALGRSMQKILASLRDHERDDPDKDYGYNSVLSSYQWAFLSHISKRLLDGVVERPTTDDLLFDVIPKLPEQVMQQICYSSADEVVGDYDKLLNLYGLEGQVPELNPDIASYIQIPGGRVPLTRRVEAVISHPLFMRLANVTQLGFVSLVYPGANHTRFEHVLGSFSQCCRHLRALWYDSANCLFQCIISSKNIEATLLAALLHDIAQYPMAHDLAEAHSDFAHERFTRQLLERVLTGLPNSLAAIVKTEWDVDVDDVLRILNANEKSHFKDRLLKSLVSGPLDCDKLDYLIRDSIYLGVSFGLSIDHERLLRNLTVAYDSVAAYEQTADGNRRPIMKLAYAEIAVREKALVIAQMLLRSREDMFTQIYWQHTMRAMKAMLSHVVRQVLIRIMAEGKEELFWQDFDNYLIDPLAWLRMDADGKALSQLCASDDSVLIFLWKYGAEPERRLLEALRCRRLYRRLAVFSQSGVSGSSRDQVYEELYNHFRTYRLSGDLEKIEETRKDWERKIIKAIADKIAANPSRSPYSAEQISSKMNALNPFLLVDIPIKALSKMSTDGTSALRYLSEQVSAVHSRRLPAAVEFSFSAVALDDRAFDMKVGKIRVLVHPDWRDLAALFIDDDSILRILSDKPY